MKKTFLCSCQTHLIEVEYSTWSKFKIPDLWIGIYDIYSPKTGRKYKKPKLISDVQFLGSRQYAKELDLFIHFLEDVSLKYLTRKQ